MAEVYLGIVNAKYFIETNTGVLRKYNDLVGVDLSFLSATDVYEVMAYGVSGGSVLAINGLSGTSLNIGDYVVITKVPYANARTGYIIVGSITKEVFEAFMRNDYVPTGKAATRKIDNVVGDAGVSVDEESVEIKGGSKSSTIRVDKDIKLNTPSSYLTLAGGLVDLKGSVFTSLFDNFTLKTRSNFQSYSENSSLSANSNMTLSSGVLFKVRASSYEETMENAASYSINWSKFVSKYNEFIVSLKANIASIDLSLFGSSKSSFAKKPLMLTVFDYEEKDDKIGFDYLDPEKPDKSKAKYGVISNIGSGSDSNYLEVVKVKSASKDNVSFKTSYPVIVDKSFLDDLSDALQKISDALTTLQSELQTIANITITPGGAMGPVSGTGIVTFIQVPMKISQVTQAVNTLKQKLNNYRSDVLKTSSKGD
jgi:hypothetical protein